MMGAAVEFLSAILVVSKDPQRLAAFYRDVLGIPLETEQHDDTLPHYGCTLGDIHFAIHPVEDFPDRRAGVGAVKLAFVVFDMPALTRRLEAQGFSLLYPPTDTGYFLATAIEDPDGNYVEFTQLRDEWYERLEERRGKGVDVIARWKQTRRE